MQEHRANLRKVVRNMIELRLKMDRNTLAAFLLVITLLLKKC
jgi:hypothetical protein